MTAGNSDAGPPTFSLEDLMEYRHTQPFEGPLDLSNNRVNVFYVNTQYRVTRKVTGWDKEPFGQFGRKNLPLHTGAKVHLEVVFQ